MAIPALPAAFACRCGAVHTCPIERVISGSGAIAQAPALLRGLRQVVLVSDGNTAPLAGDRLAGLLQEAGLAVLRAHFDTKKPVVPDETAIAFLEGALTPDTDALVGIGSGVINDLCKYVSCAAGLPYMIVATAPSMDGYASKGAAMVLGGMKVTTPARPPRWIVGDWQLLTSAPLLMLQSGIGDLLGKYSCLNDWRCASLVQGEPFCRDIYDSVMACADAAAANTEAILRRDEAAVGGLFEGLVLVGIAMSFAGNSRPASGSEHHLAHFYEIVGLQRGFPYLAHGIDVAYGALLTCWMRQQLADFLQQTEPLPQPAPTIAQKLPGWQQVYGSMSAEVEALQRKTGYYDLAHREARRQKIAHNRQQLAVVLREAPTGEDMAGLLRRAGILPWQYLDSYGKNGADVIQQSLLWAKDLKDRYTLLNLLEDTALLPAAAAAAAARLEKLAEEDNVDKENKTAEK